MTKPIPTLLSGGLPLLGHALEFKRNQTRLFERGLREVGPVFGLRLAQQPAAALIGPDYHQQFFLETDKKLSMHKTYRFLREMFGEVAFTASPEMYYRQRPILYQPFKGEKMAGYVRIMHAEIQAWLDGLGARGEMELMAELTTVVQNVAAHALMGKAFRDQLSREFWRLYADLSAGMDPLLPPNLPLPKFWRRNQARDRLHAMLGAMIAERRAHPEKYDDFMQDFINARYEDGTPVENHAVVNLIMGLMFAGHETTVGQAAWTIIRLLQNPAYLAALRAELAEKFDPHTPADLRALGNLHRVNWAVHEVTRLNPSAHLLMRLTEDDWDIGTHLIPKNWVVFVSAGAAQRLPQLFADPERFDPERFGPGREEDRAHRFAMIGFGGGMHKCAGMNFANNEMSLITALLFSQFDLELLDKDPQTNMSLGAPRPQPTRVRYARRG